jgi:predicted signal transduction protein with EAL and GGDEF domain
MIAEGIENAEQLATLRVLGCHLGQGYHLSHPITRTAIERLLSDGGAGGALLSLPPAAPILRVSRAR